MTNQYDSMIYRRCGKSGVLLPAVSLGLWHNFGGDHAFSKAREMLLGAFSLGITHFDLANNYGPPPGSAEETVGRVLLCDLAAHRDELFLSTKAGYHMWEGPYGEWGSKKHLLSSLDQSLRRMRLDYVDLFYHHRPDPHTPLEETMDALATAVRQGKALYVGLSNYSPEETREGVGMLKAMGIHCLAHQPRYSMFDRENEALFPLLAGEGVGSVAFSPLAQGLLTDRYLQGIPGDSRAAGSSVFLSETGVTAEKVEKARKLHELAVRRGQSLAQMALAWVLREGYATSVIIGASRMEQIQQNVHAVNNLAFTQAELAFIETILKS